MEETYRLLGLARRAGRLVAGFDVVRRAVARGDACLVLVAADASPGQRERIGRWAAAQGVPVRVWGSKDELGRATGGSPKAIVAVCDPGFAEQVLTRIEPR